MTDRRRAMMAAQRDSTLYSLQTPEVHSTVDVYTSSINLFDYDQDWTVFVDVDATRRECTPFFNTVSAPPSSAFNNNIMTTVATDGGICLSKGTYSGQYGTTCLVNSRVARFSAGNYPWTYTGRIKACIVHHKAAKTVDFFIKYANVQYEKKSLTYSAYPSGSYNMGVYFAGTLYGLTVYGEAKTDAECIGMIEA